MEEALSPYDALILENKWINQDPKSITFNQLLTKYVTIFDHSDGKG